MTAMVLASPEVPDQVVSDWLPDEATARALLDLAPGALVVLDPHGTIALANEATVRLFATHRSELEGRAFDRLLVESCRAAWREARARVLEPARAASQSVVVTLERPALELAVDVRRIDTPRGPLLAMALVRAGGDDDTQARAQLAAIVSSADDAIFSIDGKGAIRTWNRGAEQMFGYRSAEIIGRNVSTLLPPGSGDFEIIRSTLAARQTLARYETVRCKKDGTLLDVSLTVGPLGPSREAGYAAIVRDISDSKRTQERAASAERLAALGTMAAGMAHEINNPLAVIMANLEHVSELVKGEQVPSADLREVREVLRDALDASERIRRIVRDMRTFTRDANDGTRVVAIEEVIDAALRLTANHLRQYGRLIIRYGQTTPVRADDVRLTQVFTNLLINAAQAIEDAGGSAHQIVITTKLDDAGHVVAEVRDSGQGIAADVLPKIFDPFFTTKAIERGTGLGLSMAHTIVASFGGQITAHSEPGQGATFRVTLPAASSSQRSARAEARRDRALVIDDDVAAALTLARALRRDHDVTTVVGSDTALASLVNEGRYELVFVV